MKAPTLFSSYDLGPTILSNRVVMAPMTRCRAIGNIPNDLMAEYYAQRSGAGLIITEGTAPSPNGLGYARIPGLYNQSQVEGWKKVTEAVHEQGGKIFVQLMHTGRISHPLNMPEGAQVLAPSAVQPAGQMWTDSEQMQDYPVPKAMSEDEIIQTRAEFVSAAKHAMESGFDGVELHGANGYLLEQFLSPFSNIRTDQYGGNVENRCRFVLEVASEVAAAIGKEKTGIRLSPYGVAGDMSHYPEIFTTYAILGDRLSKAGLAYIHLVDHADMGAAEVPMEMKKFIRSTFKNTLILSGGYGRERAEADLDSGLGDLVAFGRPFINNPDLVDRFKNKWPLLNVLQTDLFYSAEANGYTDYPNHQ